MKRSFIWLLRASILALVLAPAWRPFVERPLRHGARLPISVWLHADLAGKPVLDAALAARLRDAFGTDVEFDRTLFGARDQHPLQDYADLVGLVEQNPGTQVIVAAGALWGSAASKVNAALKATNAGRAGALHWLTPEELGTGAGQAPAEYLAVSDVFLPRMGFLGEESLASVEVVGRSRPGASVTAEIVLRSGGQVLAALPTTLAADGAGLVATSVQVPLTFTRAGTQVLSATLNASLSPSPYHTASSTVQVNHAKTTVLHVAVGPDWSLRNLRQKLKFWPNLDLLSYYILREATDDLNIPSSELSLIEFPSEKLFGTELPNFHGIAVQNFSFDQYLIPQDAENLVNYVKQGGRMAFFGGPLTFKSEDPNIRALYPCENEPRFDLQNAYEWEPADASLAAIDDFRRQLRFIGTAATFVDCKPKEGVVVVARTRQGAHPQVLAMPVEKGLVLSILSGDWHTRFAQVEIRSESERAARVLAAGAVESVFQWTVEFLQRRQDSGLRPPDLVGPRLYAEDKLLQVRSRGAARNGTAYRVVGANGVELGTAQGQFQAALGLETLLLDKPLGQGLRETPSTQAPALLDLLVEPGSKDQNTGRKALPWPVLPGSARAGEAWPNPIVNRGFTPPPRLREAAPQNGKTREARSLIPLLEAYPFLLALALALLALEQFLTRILWRSQPRPDAAPEDRPSNPFPSA